MPSFAATPAGVRLQLDAQEAGLMRGLLDEMRELLGGSSRRDPVIERLFPAAYAEEPEAESDYRRYAGGELERAKLDAIERARSALGDQGAVRLEIDESDAPMWLALLTDLRLAIGTRLDVDEDRMSAPLDPRDPEAPALGVLHWLGWVQEEILARLGGWGPDADPAP